MPAVMIAGLAIAATEVLQHRFLMDLPMGWYHVLSAVVKGMIVVVPVTFFLLCKRAERCERAALRQLQASEALREDLTHMLVHDLKNPLSAAIVGSQAVLTRAQSNGNSLDAEELEMLTVAYDSQKRLGRMIEDILTVAQAEAGELSLSLGVGDVSAVVRDALEQARPLAHESRLELSGELRARPQVVMDAEKVRRVIDNLLANAIKFTPAGGSVHVSVEEAGGEARVAVRDSGPGIPEDLQGRIFGKFAQAEAAKEGRKMSVGLGLTFCRLALEAQGGRIWVESTPGEGSSFTLALPLAPVESTAARKREADGYARQTAVADGPGGL